MATPTVRAFGYHYETTSGTTNAITLSSSIVVGDRLYVITEAPYQTNTLTGGGATPWVRKQNFPDTNWSAGAVWTKVAEAGDIGATITATHSTVGTTPARVIAYYAVAGVSPSAQINIAANNGSQSTAPSNYFGNYGSPGSLVLTMATGRDGGITPTISRGTADVLNFASGKSLAMATEVLSSTSFPILITAGGTLTASSSDPSWPVSRLFDAGNTGDTNAWSAANATLPAFVRVQLPVAHTVDRYGVKVRGGTDLNGAPKTWTFDGSNNGTTWTTLDTQTAVAWGGGQMRFFTVSSPASYLYYRMNITDVQVAAGWPSFSEWELFEGSSTTGGLYVQTIGAGPAGNGFLHATIEIGDGSSYPTTDYEATVLAKSPLLFWPLKTDVRDIAGLARHAIVIGTWLFGQTQSVAPLLGNGSKAGTANTSQLATPGIAWPSGVISIEMWAEIAIDTTMFWGFTSWDAYTQGAMLINNGGTNVPFATGYPTTGLHHLVWVFSQGVALATLGKLYVDGVLFLSTGGGVTTPTLGTTNMRVSGWNNDTNYRWALNRFASHVAVYNSELTQAQVTENYQAAFAPTVTDNFAVTRSPISGAFNKTVDTTAYTTESGEPLSNGPALNTAWATMVPTASGVYQIDTIGSSYDTALAIYAPGGTLSLITSDDSSGGSGNAKVTMFMVAGTTYYLQAGGAGGATGGTLILNVSLVGGILADKFLAGGLVSLGTLASAASNPNPNTLISQPPAETVIPGCDQQVVAGTSVALAWDLQSSQNAGGSGKTVTYRLRRDNLAGAVLATIAKNATVDSSGGNDSGMAWASSYSDSSPTTGHYVLTTQATGVATTNFMAKSVFTTTGAPPSTTGYGTETGEPLTMPVAATGWVRFTPPISGYYQFDTIGTGFDTGLAVYSGTALTALTLLGSDDNSGGSGTSKLTVHLTSGVIYPVQVGAGSGTAAGTLTLTVSSAGYDSSVADPVALVGSYASLAVGLIKGRTTAAADALPGG